MSAFTGYCRVESYNDGDSGLQNSLPTATPKKC